MTTFWLPGARVVNLSGGKGYGPFGGLFLGVVAHVNQSVGDLADFFTRSLNVCPNFQVYLDGSIDQYLPLDWQPWCQSDGNRQYAAIESEGYNTDPWTDAQLNSIGRILGAYRDQLGMTMLVANQPGQPGLGWHGMGGAAWGNHPDCPGLPRRAQLMAALVNAQTLHPSGHGELEQDDDMAASPSGFTTIGPDGAGWYISLTDNTKVYCGHPDALNAMGVPKGPALSQAELDRIPEKTSH